MQPLNIHVWGLLPVKLFPLPLSFYNRARNFLIFFYFNRQELNIKKEKLRERSSVWVDGSGPVPQLIVSSQFLTDLYDRLSL